MADYPPGVVALGLLGCDTIRGSPNKFGLLGVLHNNTGSSNAQGLIDKSAGVRLFTLAANASARATYESAGFAAYEILYEKLVDRRETAHP